LDTTQLTFLLYLLLGQGILLGVFSWLSRLATRGKGDDSQEKPDRAAAWTGWSWQVGFALYLLAGQVGLLLGWNKLVEVWEATEVVRRADVVITLHFAFMLFVLFVQALVLIGWPFGWRWTRNFWLRLAQVVCIEIVAGQAIVGLECPLTSLERDLRGSLRPAQPGDSELEESDLEREKLHYLEGASPIARFAHDRLFYSSLSGWYDVVSAGFGLIVLLTWLCVPPRLPFTLRTLDRSSRTRPDSGPGPREGPGRTAPGIVRASDE
jgi:hypothetical protein